MALDKSELKQDIIDLLNEMMLKEENSIEEFAERLSDAIDDYVKKAKINYISGLIAGSAAVTGTFNGSIS